MSEPKVILIANIKGGVGKTLSAACIAAKLASAGHRTLIVDNQSGNCTDIFFSYFFSNRYDPEVGFYQSQDIVFQTSIEGLDLCCSNNYLLREFERTSSEGTPVEDVEFEDYSYVVMDSLPNMDPFKADKLYLYYLLSRARVVFPLSTECLKFGGLKATLFYFLKAKKYLSGIRFLGGFLNGVVAGSAVANMMAKNYEESLRERFFKSFIQYSPQLKSETSTDVHPYHYPSALRNEYSVLTQEILERMDLTNVGKVKVK